MRMLHALVYIFTCEIENLIQCSMLKHFVPTNSQGGTTSIHLHYAGTVPCAQFVVNRKIVKIIESLKDWTGNKREIVLPH